MLTRIKTILAGFGLSLAALMGAPEAANAYANDYCREYTRTVYIGSRTQEAYGTACLQANGDWMIVDEGARNDIPPNPSNVTYVIRDERRVIRQPRVVYYNPRYYRQPYYNDGYRNNSVAFYFGDNNRRYDNRRWDRHDKHHHHGRGRGHGRD